MGAWPAPTAFFVSFLPLLLLHTTLNQFAHYRQNLSFFPTRPISVLYVQLSKDIILTTLFQDKPYCNMAPSPVNEATHAPDKPHPTPTSATVNNSTLRSTALESNPVEVSSGQTAGEGTSILARCAGVRTQVTDTVNRGCCEEELDHQIRNLCRTGRIYCDQRRLPPGALVHGQRRALCRRH